MTPATFHKHMVERADERIHSIATHIKSIVDRMDRAPDDQDLPVTLAAKSAELTAAIEYRRGLDEAGALLV